MYVCMYVCMYIYIYICMYIFVCIYVYASMMFVRVCNGIAHFRNETRVGREKYSRFV